MVNSLIEKENIKIENLIYEIRNKQVMLDSDLAILYNCKNGTKEINQAVKNNIDKFPERFSWKLTDEESEDFLVKIFDQKNNIDTRGGKYKNPRVFTEQGVAMLATILKSEIATKVSIRIMDAFISMKKYISSELIEQNYINNLVIKNDKRLSLVEDTLTKLSEKTKVNSIFFEGQIYDAYSLLIDIFNTSKKEIIIIDNYAGKKLLDIIKNINRKIIIVSKNMDNILIKKYNIQYNNVRFINNNSFHDRFIILDNTILYHCGSSFKDLGEKCFAINLIEDNTILKKIINKI